ncbi:uncharacterized protein LAESUDRAFT_718942 [Laetiporus sulphureus 93-53]|uniref:Uncharacterized protein n=1 Tax=Laetiporus sulphureus 93-53 TaxID=1314785 RepID=A0A165I6J1_9APHY|nr:uncharacterized protein LAESUDRAFT_718942 [Laetiporus sulphureus 93-53]KZT12659.1 hypothetical protein LAESUDRAFT_718942 [Laetiporus sulphureus 93-53]
MTCASWGPKEEQQAKGPNIAKSWIRREESKQVSDPFAVVPPIWTRYTSVTSPTNSLTAH